MRTTLSAALVASLALLGCADQKSDKPAAAEAPPLPPELAKPADGSRAISIRADGKGYTPAKLSAKAGEKLTLVFTRTEENECMKEVKVPGQDKPIELPVGTPVAIPVTMPSDGELVFTCGMDMFRGTISLVP